jgi:hypothetical protein
LLLTFYYRNDVESIIREIKKGGVGNKETGYQISYIIRLFFLSLIAFSSEKEKKKTEGLKREREVKV